MKFSLGANDRQAIQPPVSATVPVTQNCIAVLFQELGMIFVSNEKFFRPKMNFFRNIQRYLFIQRRFDGS